MATREKSDRWNLRIDQDSYMIMAGLQEWNMKTKMTITVNSISKMKTI